MGSGAKYAPSAQVRRIARLAAELGIQVAGLRLGADGSVLISSAPNAAPGALSEPDEALAAWEAERNLVERSSRG